MCGSMCGGRWDHTDCCYCSCILPFQHLTPCKVIVQPKPYTSHHLTRIINAQIKVLVHRWFSLPAYMLVTNLCLIFSRGKEGRLICWTVYTASIYSSCQVLLAMIDVLSYVIGCRSGCLPVWHVKTWHPLSQNVLLLTELSTEHRPASQKIYSTE